MSKNVTQDRKVDKSTKKSVCLPDMKNSNAFLGVLFSLKLDPINPDNL